MNPIETQRDVVDQLYRIVAGSRPAGVIEARCRFDYQRFQDGSVSVGQQFEYSRDGEFVSHALARDLRQPVMGLVKQLHQLMKEHTGGDWEGFTLAIGPEGKVTTNFDYPDQT